MPLSRDYKNREKEIMSKFSQVRPNKKIIKESEEKDSKEDNDLSKMTIDKLENIINAYQYALGLDPFSYSNWNNISVYLREKEISVSQNTLQRRTFCEAVNSARNAVKYNPKEALCWTTLGEALMTARDSFRAVFCFRKALQIDPNEINAQEYLKKLGKLPKNYVLSKTQRPGKKSPSKILEIFGLHSINEITLEFDYAKFIIELYPEFINDEQLYSSIESVKKDNKFIANVIKDFLLYENT
nr:hypothetical protein [Candidatus Sigynarchaeota archaeon]